MSQREPFLQPSGCCSARPEPFAGLRRGRSGPEQPPKSDGFAGRGAAVRKVCCRCVGRRDAGVSVTVIRAGRRVGGSGGDGR